MPTDLLKVNMDWQHLIMNGEPLADTLRSWRRRGSWGTTTATQAGAPSMTTTWWAPPVSCKPLSSLWNCGGRAGARRADRVDLFPTPKTRSRLLGRTCSGSSSIQSRRGSTRRRCGGAGEARCGGCIASSTQPWGWTRTSVRRWMRAGEVDSIRSVAALRCLVGPLPAGCRIRRLGQQMRGWEAGGADV